MKSRSEVAAANAQIRKGKKELEEKFPQLEKLAKKKGVCANCCLSLRWLSVCCQGCRFLGASCDGPSPNTPAPRSKRRRS